MGIQERHYRHQVFTLIDITNTGITQSNKNNEKERNQQRNLESIHQVIGLRTQIYDVSPGFKFDNIELHNFNFGSFYLSDLGFKYNVWTFSWGVEFNAVYEKGDDPYGTLMDDFEIVPAITGLDESIPSLPHDIFYTRGEYKNIYFIPENGLNK